MTTALGKKLGSAILGVKMLNLSLSPVLRWSLKYSTSSDSCSSLYSVQDFVGFNISKADSMLLFSPSGVSGVCALT